MPSPITDRLNGLTTSVAVKAPCCVATTANITLSGLQTIDGVVLASGDRVLVKGQTTTAENGIYIAATADWTRAPDFDGSLDVVGGTLVYIASGTVGGGTYWRVGGVDSTIVIGTDAIEFAPGLGGDAASLLFVQAGIGAEARSVQTKLREVEVSVFDYMTATEIASVQAYTFVTDVTAKINAAVDYAYRNSLRLKFPPGGYLVTQIILPDDPTVDPRAYGFEMAGAGRGEAFVIVNPRGTIIRGSSATLSTLKFQQRGPSEGSGVLVIHDIRFEGTQNSGVAVVELEALYGASHLYNCDAYQYGAGDGFLIGFMATGTVDHCYSLCGRLISGLPAWIAPHPAARTGTGFILRNDISCGLATFRKCTSRGWEQAYDMGNTSGGVITFSLQMDACECSVVNHGIYLRERVYKALVDGCYFEGVNGTCVLNEGNCNTFSNGSYGVDFAVGIDDSSDANIGTIISGNDLQVGSVTPCTLIKVTSSGGPGKVVCNNMLTWSGSGGSIQNIIGIEKAGVEGNINEYGNAFSPWTKWVGGAGTAKINDITTVSGNAQSATVGLATGESIAQDVPLPMLLRGAVSFALDSTVLSTANLSGNTLTVGDTNWYEMNAGSTATVNKITGPHLVGKFVFVRTTNANTTFSHSTGSGFLKLAGSTNYTPGANGAMLGFVFDYFGSGYEMFRTAY